MILFQTMDSLSEDLIWEILQKVPGHGPSIRSVNRQFRRLCPDKVGNTRNYLETPEIFRWAIQNGLTLTPYLHGHLDRTGRKDLMEVAWDLLPECHENVQKVTPAYACRHGHLELLQWALEKGGAIVKGRGDLLDAFIHGHTHILRWAIDQGLPLDITIQAILVNGGTFETVQRFLELELECPVRSWDIESVVMNGGAGALEFLEFLDRHGRIEDSHKILTITNFAAHEGGLSMVQWLLQRGFPWDKSTYWYAVRGGDLEVLQWVHENGCQRDETALCCAAIQGLYDIFEWLLERGFRWDPAFSQSLAYSRNIEAMQWLHDRGFELDKEIILEIARFDRRGDIELWALEHL